MFESLLATMLVYGVLVWAPGLLAMNHPRTTTTPNEFLQSWSLAATGMWVPFAVLWTVFDWQEAALFWVAGSMLVTVVLVGNAILARQNMRELQAREGRVLVRMRAGL